MGWRNIFEVFRYDVPHSDSFDVNGDIRGTIWKKAVDLPWGTSAWRIHNRGMFNAYYAYEKKPAHWEILEPDVADFKDRIPRHIFLGNQEIVADRHTEIYIEWWTDEALKEKGKMVRDQLYESLTVLREILRDLWRR